MVKENKKITVTIKELNNKSRQGTYIYIKEAGQRPSYYRYNEQYPLDYYVNYYQNLNKRPNRKGGTKITQTLNEYDAAIKKTPSKLKPGTQAKTDAQKYLKKLKKQYGGRSLERLLKKGIQAVRINNILTATNNTIHVANRKLIQDIVLDKRIQDIIASEENMKKMKFRLEHRIELINTKGETLATLNKVGKTLRETTNDLKNTLQKGQEIKYEKSLNTLKGLGYNTNFNQKGTLNRIQVTTILRKTR